MENVAQFFPFILLFGVLLLMIVPQQRKAKQHRELLAALGEGDEVILNSGIYGFVSSLDEGVLWLEVAEGVEFKVSKASVATVIQEEQPDNPITE